MNSSYRTVVGLVRGVLRMFFRRVEVSGLEHIPEDGGGVLVAWHPNGLVDPGLILTHFPREVVFGARSGLFSWPLLGQLMKAIGTVPIYRPQDGAGGTEEERRAANNASLDALAERVATGQFSCLFPEGTSHDSPHLLELRTGAARFWYRSRELQADGAAEPVILPVGLHYDSKRGFRSDVLIAFHPPLTVPEFLRSLPEPSDAPETLKKRYQHLTDEMERVLNEVVLATEDWELHHLMNRARKLVRAERAARAGANPGRPGLQEKRLGFERVWRGYYARRDTHPERVGELVDQMREYHRDMRALRMEDHELDHPPQLWSPWLGVLLALQVLFVFVLLPPLILIGFAINGPVFLALGAFVKGVAKEKKDEATLKLLLGTLLFPLAWAGAGVGAFFAHEQLHALYPSIPNEPVGAALLLALLGVIGGTTALRYLRLTRETSRALRVRLTKARRRIALARLKVERGDLHDGLISMADGLDLPGTVGDDGRIGRT